MGEGDIALNSMLHPPIGASFPLKDYFGSTIILYPQTCDDVPELAGLGISAREIFRKYSLAEHCRVFRRNEAVEHVYRELYGNLAKPKLTFLRLKLLELLYHIQADQTVLSRKILRITLLMKLKLLGQELCSLFGRHLILII